MTKQIINVESPSECDICVLSTKDLYRKIASHEDLSLCDNHYDMAVIFITEKREA